MTKSPVKNCNKKGKGGHNESKFPSPKKDNDARGAEISFFPQPLLNLLKVGLLLLQMGSVAPMKLLM